MDVIVIDSENIYVVPISENVGRDTTLEIYMRTSGESLLSSEYYTYCIKKQSDNLYTIQRKFKVQDESVELALNDLMPEIDIASWWGQAYPIIEQIAGATGAVTGVVAITSAPFIFVKWVRKMLQLKNKIIEYPLIQYVLSKDTWNVSELSETLSISNKQAKDLLKGFGFVWNAHKMLYISTENTEKLRAINPEKL